MKDHSGAPQFQGIHVEAGAEDETVPEINQRRQSSQGFSMKSLAAFARRPRYLAVVDQFVASGANFLTGAVIGRVCSKDEFGLYMLGLSIVFVAMSPQASLITAPYTVYSPRLKGRALARFTGSMLVHQFLLSLVISIAVASVGAAMLVFDPDSRLASVMIALAIVISFILFKELLRRIWFARMNFLAALVFDIGVSALQVSGLFAIAWFGALSASSCILLIGGVCILGCIGWIIGERKKIAIDFGSVFSDFLQNWSLGKWLFFSVLLWNIGSNIYPWLLKFFHGTSETGVFAACMGVVAVANPISLAAANFVGPRLAHTIANDGMDEFVAIVKKNVFQFALVISPFCIVISAIGGWLAVMIYGDKYVGNGLPISLLSINLLVMVIATPVSRALHALERTDKDFAVNCIPLVVMVVLGAPLVKGLGVTGAAISLLVGNVLSAIVRWFVVERIVRDSLKTQVS